ncbi:MAG TPA: phosphoglycolate phosphatase [Rhodoblastus sp.]|nr:phosphoglycolate phosphatase [Rhodoblastus sp.]
MIRAARWAFPAAPAFVAFDLDGTLVDSAPDIAWSVNAVLAADGLPPHTAPAVRGMIGHGLERLVERAFEAHGVTLDPQILHARQAAMAAVYADHLVDLTRLRAGACEAVKAVRGPGLRSGVVTNKPEAFARTILTHFGLLADLDVVVGGDSGYPKKPAPDMLLAACAVIGVPPRKAVLIGDSGADLASARAAGVICVLVRGGYSDRPVDELDADLVIDELDALPMILGLSAEAPQ